MTVGGFGRAVLNSCGCAVFNCSQTLIVSGRQPLCSDRSHSQRRLPRQQRPQVSSGVRGAAPGTQTQTQIHAERGLGAACLPAASHEAATPPSIRIIPIKTSWVALLIAMHIKTLWEWCYFANVLEPCSMSSDVCTHCLVRATLLQPSERLGYGLPYI